MIEMKKDYKVTVKKVNSTSINMNEESMEIAIAKVSNLVNRYIEDENKLSLIFCEDTAFIYKAVEIKGNSNNS